MEHFIQVDIQVVRPEFYPELPFHATPGSAGCDLRICIDEARSLWPGEAVRLPVGIKVALPRGWTMILIPRSGLGSKGMILGNLIGLIDPDYRGEISVSLWNRTERPMAIYPGHRVAQAIFVPYAQVVWNPLEELDATERGEGGHGSTGEK